MIGEIFDEHTRTDIVDAQNIGIDGFAMNFGKSRLSILLCQALTSLRSVCGLVEPYG
jgi:hypothetical protein